MSTPHSALDVLAVGLGKTGGQVAGELARRGYSALAIHTSRRGLEEQANIAQDRCLFVGGERATNGEPEYGRNLIRDHAPRIEAFVGGHSGKCDVALVIASLGGGTGSAIGALVQAIDRQRTKLVAMILMPEQSETVERRMHALRAVKELTDAGVDGLIIVDGDKLVARGSGLSILEYDGRTHERVVEPFEALDKIESRSDLRGVRPLRGRQLLDVLTHGGVVTMGAYAIDELSAGSVLDALITVLQESEMHPDGLDLRSASAVQIVIEAPESVLRGTPIKFVDTLREDVKGQSPGVHVDVAIYQRVRDEGPIAVHVVASCAELPARLREMVEDVAHEAAATRDKPRKPATLDLSILGDDRPATGDRIRTPEREGATARTKSDVAPRPADDDLSERGPNAAVYARLVTRYKSTGNDELQRAIVRRLEQDRLTDDPRVRVLAVGAMGQIGAHVFDAALVAATEDESPEVRRVAEQGLAHSNPTRRAV
ncbi:MAG: HEAT repeat domain-containing protein [Sandaracinaceae bacterium]|nr:HEAT repeat domain-containing protein [Sandaracinaceae bacterium]